MKKKRSGLSTYDFPFLMGKVSGAADAIPSANVRLLLHLNGNLADSSQYATQPGGSVYGYSNTSRFPGQSADVRGVLQTQTMAYWPLGSTGTISGLFSADLWVNLPSDSSSLLSFTSQIGTGQQFWRLQVVNGVLSASMPRYGNASNLTFSFGSSGAAVPTSQWVHIAWDRLQSGQMNLYVNGYVVASATHPDRPLFDLGGGDVNPGAPGVDLRMTLPGDWGAQFLSSEVRLLKDLAPYEGRPFTPMIQRYDNPV